MATVTDLTRCPRCGGRDPVDLTTGPVRLFYCPMCGLTYRPGEPVPPMTVWARVRVLLRRWIW